MNGHSASQVMGDLGTGKSTLVNALLNEPDCFGVSSQAAAFTKGVDVTEARNFDTCGHKVVFADMEGRSDKGRAYDVKLATPVLLTAKAVVLNIVCPTRPSKVQILEVLAISMEASRQVSNRRDRTDMFGHLHVVLRGCTNTEDECHKIIFGREETGLAETDDEENAMNERNTIRGAIQCAFEGEPRVWCVPAVQSAGESFNYADVSYAAKIDEMRRNLVEQMREPKRLDRQPLTGAMIAAMMPKLKEDLRSDDVVLNPPSIMDAVFDAECTRIKDEVLSAATSRFESAAIPMDAAELANLKQEYISDFHGRTSSYPEANRNKVLASFNSTLDALAKEVDARNRQAHAEQAGKEARVKAEEEIIARAKAEEKRRASEEEARRALEAKLELERQLEKEKNKPPEYISVDGGGCAPLSPSSGSSGGRRRGPVLGWVRNKDGSRNMKYKTKRMVSPNTGKPDRRCKGNK